LNLVRKHGVVRGLITTLEGEFGSHADIEISAAGNKAGQPDHIGLLIRAVTSRGQAAAVKIAPRASDDVIEASFHNLSLDQIVKASTEAIERKRISEALAASSGNRTAAARRLGLSRQSLHAKLNRYNLEEK
jgi:DNA-binding NtrC family response regulator